MTTVAELIERLKEIKNPNQSVIYQYYLASHFGADDQVFEKVATRLDSEIPSLFNSHDIISEYLCDEGATVNRQGKSNE